MRARLGLGICARAGDAPPSGHGLRRGQRSWCRALHCEAVAAQGGVPPLFFDPTEQRYGETGAAAAVQSHQVFPLYLGVVPTEYQAAAVAALVESVANQSYHPNTGIIGSCFLLETLTRYGHADVALKLATHPECPGWGYMVERAHGDPANHEVPSGSTGPRITARASRRTTLRSRVGLGCGSISSQDWWRSRG